MGFHHLDRYADAGGPLARLAPAARVLGVVVIALGAALLPPGAWPQMTALLLLVLLLAVLARVPLAVFAARAAAPLALLALASAAVLVLAPGEPLARLGPLALTDAGLQRFTAALGRGAAAVGAGVLLVSTTRFPELVEALRELRLPAAVTAALGLAYRYLYLLTDELERLRRAAASRNARRGSAPRRRLLVALAASAFTRSYARSERVHRAMLARGYTGALASLRPHPLERGSALAVAGLAGVVAGIVAWARL